MQPDRWAILLGSPAFHKVPMSPKKRRKFSAGKAARRVARELLGQPPAERVIPDKRRKPPKHKKPLVPEEVL